MDSGVPNIVETPQPTATVVQDAALHRGRGPASSFAMLALSSGRTPTAEPSAAERVREHQLELFAETFPRWVTAFVVLNGCAGLVSTALFIWLVASFVSDKGVKCDIPLRIWVIVEFVGTACSLVHLVVCQLVVARTEESTQQLIPWYGKLYSIMVAAFDFCWLSIGLHWLHTTETCPQIMPELYVATKVYAACCMAFAVVVVVNAVGLYTIMSWMLRNGMLSSNEAAPPGTLQKMRILTFEPEGDEFQDMPECCICLVTFCASTEIRSTPCDHVFHSRCLDNWLKLKRACPLCRRDLVQSCQSSLPQYIVGRIA